MCALCSLPVLLTDGWFSGSGGMAAIRQSRVRSGPGKAPTGRPPDLAAQTAACRRSVTPTTLATAAPVAVVRARTRNGQSANLRSFSGHWPGGKEAHRHD